MNLNLGKYRGIIVSVALFLLLDASVLMMNFYISFEIADDAVGVNIAGRQRMLSQRMMKSLLDIDNAQSDPSIQKASISELKNTVNLFNSTLNAFDQGAEVVGADGNNIAINPVTSPSSLSAIQQAKEIWKPYQTALAPLLLASDRSDISSEDLFAVITYGRANNVTLLKLMNQLTVDLEQVASSKATRLRIIQTVGISLAIINFFIIMFHFLRQLRESDEKIEAARKETKEILDTVNEGLFLLDKDQIIGDQHSNALLSIFSDDKISGKSFSELLSNIISDKEKSTAQSFVRLLFDPKKKQKLIGDLNPLRQIQVHIPSKDGHYESKYLSFSFSRVTSGKEIVHVLVTVQDITAQVELAEALELSKAKDQEQIEMLSAIIHSNSDLLATFLKNSLKTFEQINDQLKLPTRTSDQHLNKANSIFAMIHNFKGEAAAMELIPFVDMAHNFEEELQRLNDKSDLSGNDFLSLTVLLNRLIQQTEAVSTLAERVSGLFAAEKVETPAETNSINNAWGHLPQLAASVANNCGKRVDLICSGLNEYALPDELRQEINSIAVQLIRNAVVHGIESSADRLKAEKNSIGEIDVRFSRRANGNYQLVISDDGNGLDMDAIRSKAIEQAVISEQQAESIDSKQTASLIFHPSLSTTDTVSNDAGRGIGMHAVRESVKKLAGKITIKTRRGQGTSFTLTFPSKVEVNKVATATA